MTMNQSAVLVAEPASVAPQGTIKVTWRDLASFSSSAWVGLYANSGAADTAYLGYKYLSAGTGAAASGSVTFTMPEGASTTYEFRIFSDGGYNRKAKSASVTVNPFPPMKLTAEPRSVKPGGTVTVAWSNGSKLASSAWVGLYAKAADGDRSYMSYKTISASASGTVAFTMPDTPSETYEFRVFSDSGYERRATTGSVTVTAPPAVKLVAEPKSVAPGDTVTVTWSDVQKPSTSFWVGLFENSTTTAYYSREPGLTAWRYITATSNGSMSFTMPKAPSTTYEFRLFLSGGYSPVGAVTAPIAVVAPSKPPEKVPGPTEEEVAALKTRVTDMEQELIGRQRRIDELTAKVEACARCEEKNEELELKVASLEEEIKAHAGHDEASAEQQKVIAAMQAELKECAHCKEELAAKTKALAELEQKPAPTGARPDDITVIEGIGPAIAELLKGIGITTFAQLAAAEVSRLESALAGGGSRFSLADPTTWPAQAKLAAEGRWDELKVLQAQLRAGRQS